MATLSIEDGRRIIYIVAYWILVLLDRPCVQSSDLHQGGGTVSISFDITCCAGDSDFRRGIQYEQSEPVSVALANLEVVANPVRHGARDG